jgi:propionaldehyde dehydrogenase
MGSGGVGLLYSESEIAHIVREVMQRTLREPVHGKLCGVFGDILQAIEAAKASQKTVRDMSFTDRERVIQNIRKSTLLNAETMAQMAVQETGMGNVAHKIAKHQLTAQKTPGTEDLTTTAWSGDHGLTLVEQGPFGVIGAVTPSTNPSETVICNTIGMFAAGNTVVFNTHPGAKNVSNFAVDMLNKASMEAGGPDNIAVSVYEPTLETSKVLFAHKDIPLLVATGGPGVVTAVLSSGKRGIGAGAGNPPVLADETADIAKAARDIVNGATFDNNLPCIAEKSVVAVESIYEELIYHMRSNGCYLADADVVNKLLLTVIIDKSGKKMLNRKCVGKDAKTLLSMVGVNVDDNIRCVIFPANANHLLVEEELMMPILGIVKVKNFDEGLTTCVKLEQGNRHSAHIHSKNVDHLTRYGKAVDTAIYVKNGPSYNSLGFEGEGFATFTIASRTGEGLTSARTFTKSRRCVMSDSLCIR